MYFISDDPGERLASLDTAVLRSPRGCLAVPRGFTQPSDPPHASRRARARRIARSARRCARTATYSFQSVGKLNIITYYILNFITISLMPNHHHRADVSGSTGAAALRHGRTLISGQSGTPRRAIPAQTPRAPRRIARSARRCARTATYSFRSVGKLNIITYYILNFITISLMPNHHHRADVSGSTGAAALRHGRTLISGQSGMMGMMGTQHPWIWGDGGAALEPGWCNQYQCACAGRGWGRGLPPPPAQLSACRTRTLHAGTPLQG